MNNISKTEIDTNFVEKREAIALATLLEYNIYDKSTKTQNMVSYLYT